MLGISLRRDRGKPAAWQGHKLQVSAQSTQPLFRTQRVSRKARILSHRPNRAVVAVLAALILGTLITAVFAAKIAEAEVTSVTSSVDTKISERAPTTTYGSATTLSVDGDEPSNRGTDEYALLRWDLSPIPAGSKVDSASVTLNVTNPSKDTYLVYALERSWSEQTATWQLSATGSPWEVPGAKGSNDKEAQVAGSVVAPKVGKQSFALSAAVVEGWIDDPTTNNGIIIADPMNRNGFDFSSSESAAAADRPQIRVTYTTGAPPEAMDTTPPETVIDSGPSGTVSSGSASFAFSSTESGSSFECKLDAEDFRSCTSPKSYTGLSDGSHTFYVKATDGADNVDATPATHTWRTENTGPTGPTPSASEPRLFAHWHTPAQPVNTVDDLRSEIRKAKAMGLDGFAYNVTPGMSEWTDRYRYWIDNLYQAANAEGDFYLFPSVDFCCGSDRTWVDTVMLYKYDDPARLRVDGKPVIQSWLGETSLNWQDVLNDYADQGKPVYFIPNFSPGDGGPSRLYSDYPYIPGFFNFSSFANGDDSLYGVKRNYEYDLAADAAGRDAMLGVSPNFNRHSGTEQFGNRILGDFQGFHTWIEEWKEIVADDPRFVEVVTWNDYLEGSYIGGPYAGGQLPSGWAGNSLDHGAFRKLAEYYTAWYKTGRQPQITTDTIAIAHRPHSKNAVACCDPLPRPDGYQYVEDRLYAAVILKAPAQIRLESGNTSQTFDVAAGVHELSMPFAEGTQRIVLVRNGQSQLSATSPTPVNNAISEYNFNVATAFAEQ
jgi:Glycosyl hydrolase family 71